MSLVAKISENVHVGAREYLTFRLDQEEYGIDILKVQEIRGYEQPTRIANAPAFSTATASSINCFSSW